MKFRSIIIVVLLTVLMASGCSRSGSIDSFEDCVAAGNPVMESYPRQCNADGRTFFEQIEGNVGESCTTDDECILPADYAIRSSCPYEARCINSSCKVLCPWDMNSEIHRCTQEERQAEICTMEYAPVCGDDGKTYGNSCSACASGNIDSYHEGECLTEDLGVIHVPPDKPFYDEEKPIGGDRDSHGCLTGAGYSWNSTIGACLREWELVGSSRTAAKMAADSVSYDVTIIEVAPLRCPGCFDVRMQGNKDEGKTTVEIRDWKIQVERPRSEQDLAYMIAQDSNCTTIGDISPDGKFNDYSDTWQFLIDLFEKDDLCNAACIVDLESKSASINWMCTGAILE